MEEIPPEHKHLFLDTDTGETKEELRRKLTACRQNLTGILFIAGSILLLMLLNELGWL